MNIALLGSRGIPNRYGGYERFAERLSLGLIQSGDRVEVYCPHYRNRGHSHWGPVRLRYAYNPEVRVGAPGNFVYDLQSLLMAVIRHRYDIVYMLGYTSSAPFLWLSRLRRPPILVTNMDGLEWKRSKWSPSVRQYLRLAERLAVIQSDHLITDSRAVGAHLEVRYGRTSHYIPYGADLFCEPDPDVLPRLGLEAKRYFLVVARIEPENNLEMVIRAFLTASLPPSFRLVVVGDPGTRYGQLLRSRYRDSRLRFMGTLYHQRFLDTLRFHSSLYVHGHSVGGTNPALLEAMACGAPVSAHDNPFNREVLAETGLFFSHHGQLAEQMEAAVSSGPRWERMGSRARDRIRDRYSWTSVIVRYHDLFQTLIRKPRS